MRAKHFFPRLKLRVSSLKPLFFLCVLCVSVVNPFLVFRPAALRREPEHFVHPLRDVAQFFFAAAVGFRGGPAMIADIVAAP